MPSSQKKMALQEQNSQLLFDALLCKEECFAEDFQDKGYEEESANNDKTIKMGYFSPPNLLEQDFFWDWEDEELRNLFSKEKQAHLCYHNLTSDVFPIAGRKETIEWILRVSTHYGFKGLTSVLAVNYFDRFCSSIRFQTDNPWMPQLAAVACLSLSAKVEETQVPLLLDLQVEECKYVFETKTIQRMELLVLSALQWRMNLVTPFSFFDHITRRLGLRTKLCWDFLWICEQLLLSIIADSRFVCYLPSVIAAAIMLCVIKEIELCNAEEYQNQLMNVLVINEEEVYGCYRLIVDVSCTGKNCLTQSKSRKRKYPSIPGSLNGVIDGTFSSDSSNDSWTVVSSLSSSPAPRFKRSRFQDQPMRLPSVNNLSMDALSSPR